MAKLQPHRVGGITVLRVPMGTPPEARVAAYRRMLAMAKLHNDPFAYYKKPRRNW